ncbi:acetylornithine deacetylase [Arboricoccus pini]|uniref:Acetylornithine deacetylase n=1 Tax=Arboricoccus pini TaxID=1963835 RepID=A0A212RYN6_9PROT|nr:M20/M25/M40 family metallo-hydrolase [Arboricoccus pini]SNB77919.1 acetylornithine deacetylase [Arboricoccus pini]
MTAADTATVAALLSDLVAIPSINPAFRRPDDPPEWFGEARMAAYVEDWLKARGFVVTTHEVMPGRPNVVATLKGRRSAGRLLWECHTDTVQVGGMTIAPFDPVIREGRLYGRGAIDDKACVTAMMLALADLADDPPELDVTLVAAVDEEFQFKGVLHHLASFEGLQPYAAEGATPPPGLAPAIGGIAGEPTDLRLVSACKGCMRWRIEVKGKSAHSSQPAMGIDAIEIAGDLLAYLRAHYAPILATRHHELVGSPTMICSMIEGGQGPNTVAERCLLTFDRRTQPGEEGLAAWREIDAHVQAFAARLPAGAAILNHPPFIDSTSMEVAADTAIVRAAHTTLAAEGIDPALLGVAYGSDATKMTMAGIPTLVFGPGSIDQAHTADEYAELHQVARASRMLAAMARAARA